MEKTQLEQQKENIISKIEQIEKFDIEKIAISKKEFGLWQSLESNEILNYINQVFVILKTLKNKINILDTAQIGFVSNLDMHLQNIIDSYVNIQNIETESITTQNHHVLNYINALYNIFWSTPLLNQLSIESEYIVKNDIKNAIPLLNKFLGKKRDFEEASISALNWIQNKGKLDELAVRDQANAFLARADVHKVHSGKFFSGTKWWLIGAFVFAISTGWITFSFLELIDKESTVSIGQAILRVTSLLVPAYLTAFCSNQFLYHKKMHEAYMFKYASLNTMNYLIGNTADPIQKERILSKGLDVLFSEPKIKESAGEKDKQIVTELLGMLRTQLK